MQVERQAAVSIPFAAALAGAGADVKVALGIPDEFRDLFDKALNESPLPRRPADDLRERRIRAMGVA